MKKSKSKSQIINAKPEEVKKFIDDFWREKWGKDFMPPGYCTIAVEASGGKKMNLIAVKPEGKTYDERKKEVGDYLKTIH